MSNATILSALTANITTEYNLGRQIGQPGQYGCAFLCEHKKTGEQYAAKRISKAKFMRSHEDDRKFYFRSLREEISIMRSLEPHRNIIQISAVFEDKEALWIVMECCKGGELFDRIKDQPTGSYTEQDAASVLQQMCEGIRFLHDNKIAHCDLKPDNFLFSTNEKDADLKIIDFGMSKKQDKPWKYLTSFRGTPYYVAPEVLQKKYTSTCDMWSFGVVMFVMLFGFPPFHGQDDDEIFKKIEKGFCPEVKPGYGAWFPESIPVSEDARDLMTKCLDLDAAKRFSAAEALDHKWFKGGAGTEPLLKVLDNLKAFTANTQFKNEVLSLMTDYMSNEELLDLKNTFKLLDVDGNGLVSMEEFKQAMVNKNFPEADVTKLMEMADIDGDGNLSYSELVLTSVQRKICAKEERLYEAFCAFDKDRDGTITGDEIAKVLNVSAEKAKELLDEIDTNGDGVIDYTEFSNMMVKKEEEAMGALLG